MWKYSLIAALVCATVASRALSQAVSASGAAPVVMAQDTRGTPQERAQQLLRFFVADVHTLCSNHALSAYATVGGCLGNSASGGSATVAGGHSNVASSLESNAPGGYGTEVGAWKKLICR